MKPYVVFFIFISTVNVLTAADYMVMSDEVIFRRLDDAHIPTDPNNVDYQRYLKWVAEGNVPDPYVPPEPEVKPQPVTADQILDALLAGQDLKDIQRMLGELKPKDKKP